MKPSLLTALVLVLLAAGPAQAQIAPPSPAPGGTRVAPLSDILINSLRATTADQQAFVRRVVRETNAGRLERRLVLAVMVYSQQQSPVFPFPYFEQLMRHEARKRGVHLPSVTLITSTRIPRR